MPTLRELLRNVSLVDAGDGLDVRVEAISYDSRTVKPGDLFVAVPGFHTDGADFIREALDRGAIAVVTQRSDVAIPEAVPCLLVPDARAALADLADAFYGHPTREVRVVGVTGTDGKTTTAHLVSAALEAMGHRTGIITTVDVKVGDRIWYNDTQQTTPQPVEIQRLVRQMADDGVGYAVLESSSHALALERLRHCEFDAAVFTNLAPEHLDFHGTMEEYLSAKARLFSMLDASQSKGVQKAAILNADDPHSIQLRAATAARTIWYGLRAEDRTGVDRLDSVVGSDSSITASDLHLSPGGTRFLLETPLGCIQVESRLPGRFNVYNWLAAASVALSQGASLEQIRQAIGRVDSIPGRMQRIEGGQAFAVVVDFAHTPQALRTVLTTLRPITSGRLMVVFGLAGERDAGNRPVMGELAARMADFAIFTTDDPRFEDPMEIAEQIAAGARAAGWEDGRDFLKIADREETMREMFRRARPGDTVLLAGKGHERRQVIRGDLIPWNDAEAARRLLQEMGLRAEAN